MTLLFTTGLANPFNCHHERRFWTVNPDYPRHAVDDFGDYITNGAWCVAFPGHVIALKHCGTFGAVSPDDARLIGVYACLRQVL